MIWQVLTGLLPKRLTYRLPEELWLPPLFMLVPPFFEPGLLVLEECDPLLIVCLDPDFSAIVSLLSGPERHSITTRSNDHAS